MASLASLIIKIGADSKEIESAFASIGVKARGLDSDLKKLGNTPLAGKTQESLNSLKASMNAVTDAQARIAERATLAAAGIQQMGGAAALTQNQLKQMTRLLDEGVSASKALGKEVPDVLQRMATDTKAAINTTNGLKDALKGLAGAFGVAFSFQQLVNFGRDILRMSEDIVRVADRTGLLTDEVQQLSYIASQSGNTIDEFTAAIGQLQNRLSSGDKSAAGAVKQLNINLQELREATPYEQLKLIANGFANIEDPAKRAQLAIDLFGKAGVAILPSLTSEFEKLGNAAPKMSEATVRALESSGDALETFQLQVKVWAAESYNNARKFFDSFLVWSLRAEARFLDFAATLADRTNFVARMLGTLVQAIPGGIAVSNAFNLAGGTNPAEGFKQQAQQARDAADAMEELTAADERNTATKKRANVVLGETDEALKSQADAAKKLKDVQDQLFGRAIIANAELLVRALGNDENLTKLTADATKKLHEELGQALVVYRALGREVPKSLQDIYDKTTQLQLSQVSGPQAGTLIFREAIPENVIMAAKDYSKVLSATGVQVDKLGNAVKVNLMPSLDGLKKTFDEGQVSVRGFGESVKQSFTELWASLKDVKGNIQSVVTGIFEGFGNIISGGIASLINKGIGLVTKGIGALYDKIAGRGGRNLVKDFGEQFGGLNNLRERLNALGDEGEKMWGKLHGFDASDKNSAKRAIEEVTEALRKAEEQFRSAQSAIEDITEKLSDVTVITPDLQSKLEKAFAANNVQDFSNALNDVNAELDKQAQKFDDINDALQKYGIAASEAQDPIFKTQTINKRAKELKDDFDAIRAAGVDVNVQMRAMGENIREFVKQAQKAGVEVPEFMIELIQRSIDAGELLDDNGNKITDLTQLGLTFGTTMQESMRTVGQAVDRLTLVLEGLAKFLGIALPNAAEKGADKIQDALDSIEAPTISVDFDVPEGITYGEGRPGDIPGFEKGSGGIKDFGSGQLAVLHGREGVFTEDQLRSFAASAQTSGSAGAMAPAINITFTGAVLATRDYIEREVVGPVLDGIERYHLKRFARLQVQAGGA